MGGMVKQMGGPNGILGQLASARGAGGLPQGPMPSMQDMMSMMGGGKMQEMMSSMFGIL